MTPFPVVLILVPATSTALPPTPPPARERSPVSFGALSVQMSKRIAAGLDKPRLGGVLNQAAFVVAVALAPLLIVTADGGRARFAAAVFAGSVAACFGASALYHRVTWKPRARLWMRRIDHAGVYLLIAGTYTPVSLLVLRGAWRPVVLTIIWAGAAAAIVLKFVWVAAPKWLPPAIGIALGWVAVIVLPQLIGRVNLAAGILLLPGGLANMAGVVISFRGRPGALSAVFGFPAVVPPLPRP